MKKTVVIITIITIFSKILGFARDLVLSFFYGTSYISDAYLISQTIPNILFGLIGASISMGYIPVYSRVVKENGEKQGDIFTNNLLNFILIISTVIVFFSLGFTKSIVKLFASGFDEPTLRLAIMFTRISIIGVYLSGMKYIFSSYLHVKGNFVIPALLGFPLNIITIIFIYLSAKLNIHLLVIGGLLALLSQIAFLCYWIIKSGFIYSFRIDFKDRYLKKLVYISMPVIVGISINQINTLVDRTIASQIAVGAISALNYANRLNGFIQGIFVATVATVMYPMISRMIVNNNIDGLKASIQGTLNYISLLVVPITIGSMIFCREIITLLFGRGAFNEMGITLTSVALLYYSPGMIGAGLHEVLIKAFYSMNDTRTPLINSSIGIVVNVVLNIILSSYLGIGGLALATSISILLTTALMFISLRKKIGPFGLRQTLRTFIKVLLASLFMGLIAKKSFVCLNFLLSSNMSLIIAILIGALSYFIIIYFMKIKDVSTILSIAIRRFKSNTCEK